jgi:predicted O-methyltransferase YrrM
MFTRNEKKYLAGITLLLGTADMIGYLLLHQPALILAQTLLLLLLLALQLSMYRALDTHYQQVEALFSLFSTLPIRQSLPRMRGWAVSPDFAQVVCTLIKEHKPKLVLELGSGASTLVAGYSLEEVGQGRIISLDHDQRYATLSSSAIRQHHLQDTAAVVYAPLKEVVLGEKSWLWYDLEQVQHVEPIDMLIIDGPPGITQKLARYPALPILFRLLSNDAVILLDDAFRRDEKETVKRWLREFADFSLEELDLEKGAVVMRRQTTVEGIYPRPR